jgi:hypothetical protein
MCRSCKPALSGLNKAARARQHDSSQNYDNRSCWRLYLIVFTIFNFSIPLFTAMSDDDQGRVIAALRAVVR